MCGNHMITSHNETKGCKVYVFVIGAILALIATGLLIYLCIYLTEYNANTNSITLQSMTNRTNDTSKHATLAAILVNDTEVAVTPNKVSSKAMQLEDDDDDDVSMKAAAIDSLQKVDVPVFTRVILPSKPVKKVIYVPENIVLQNVTPPHT